MSYFTPDGTNQEPNGTPSFVDQIVSEKGEQWKDPEVIAKGYAASQEHIAKLELDLKAAEAEKSKTDYMKEVLDTIQKNSSPAVGEKPNGTNDSAPPPTPEVIGVDQIKELVKEAVTVQEQNRTSSQNLMDADAKLKEKFGTEVGTVVNQRAQELGLTKEYLQSMAEQSPTAFLALIGEPQGKETNSSTSSTVNTSATVTTSGKKNFAHYNKLRKENPRQYRQPSIQNEMLEERLKQGADFYNS